MPCSKIWRKWALGAVAAALTAALYGCSRETLPARAALEEEKPGEDQVARFPPPPKPENLARIDTGPAGSFEFFIDTESIEVLGKGEFRYTLVARSGTAATNASYEGLRCLTRERRLYAVGRSDGTWVPPRKSEWRPFSRTEYSQIHVILSADYFCPDRQSVLTVQEAVRAVKYGGRRTSAVP